MRRPLRSILIRSLRPACLISIALIAAAPVWPACPDGVPAAPSASPPKLSFPRTRATAVTGADGRVYSIGGYADGRGYLSTVEAYDPGKNRWSEPLKPMPTPRDLAAAALGDDGRIYVIGGSSDTGRRETEAFDPSKNSWTRRAPMPNLLWSMGAATGIDGRIYVAGGMGENDDYRSALIAYDTHDDRWIGKLPSMPTHRSEFAMVAAPDGRIYAIGGTGPDGAIAAVEAYDPIARLWYFRKPMPHPRTRMAAVAGADGRIYVFGGLGPAIDKINMPSAVFVYDTESNTWSIASGLQPERESLAGAATPDGRILAIGGDMAPGIIDSVDIVSASPSPLPSHVPCGPSGTTTMRPQGNAQIRPIDRKLRPRGAPGAADWTLKPAASPQKSELYALLVGISAYANPAIDLKFAAGDAESIGKAIELGAMRQYGAKRVHLITLSTERENRDWPNKRRIEMAFEEVARRAQTSDTVVVYLAGHGLRLLGGGAEYAFLTQDALDMAPTSSGELSATTVMPYEISRWMAQVHASNQFIILDTCAAGGAMSSWAAEIAAAEVNAPFRAIAGPPNLYVLMGSAADEASYETSSYRHSLLAEALLDGVTGKALGRDGIVDAIGLMNWISAEVPRLAGKEGRIQRPHLLIAGTSSLVLGRFTPADRAALMNDRGNRGGSAAADGAGR